MDFLILPSQQYLKQRLDYDPNTGELRWKPRPRSDFQNERAYGMWHGRYSGKIAGYVRRSRFEIGIDGLTYFRARIIWKWMTGQDPRYEIDHQDRDLENERWSNLREATRSQNQANKPAMPRNQSGFKGVTWVPKLQKWQARIVVNKRIINLGFFLKPEIAHQAYCQAAKIHFGTYACTSLR